MAEWQPYACYGLMLIVAVAASITDLRLGLIRNKLIGVGLLAALLLHAVLMLLGNTYLLALAANLGIGLGIALALYGFRLWSAGDAKLAIFLALAQPAWLELEGPVPWAPVFVLLGNALLLGLLFVAVEAIWRGFRPVTTGLASCIKERRFPWTRESLLTALRVITALAAVVTSLSPIRQWLMGHAGDIIPGGPFFTLLALVVVYRPLKRLALTRPGIIVACVLLVVGAAYHIGFNGEQGVLTFFKSIAMAVAVVTVRGILGAASEAFDSRDIDGGELEPGMVLADGQLQRMAADERWLEAFAPHMDDLTNMKLDQNYVDNVVEWHQHNAEGEKISIRAPLPFAPAMAAAVILTALFGRLLVP